ncbi:CopD family protein [Peribacillus saganii]|nr:CopD family protein [Peribacillus saganii]
MISWKSTGDSNWDVFRKWFTPFALTCVFLILLAGIILMEYTVPEYLNSWLLPYGEALLLKHLLYALVLIFGFINGFVQKKQMNKNWLRAESGLLLIVYIVTAFMSQSVPPKDVSYTIDTAGISPIIMAITGDEWDSQYSVGLAWNLKMMIFVGISILITVSMSQVYEHKTRPYLFALFGCLLVLALFFTILLSIVPLT